MFRTQYKYDSFGRIRNIIYLDGEVIYYGYTTRGKTVFITAYKLTSNAAGIDLIQRFASETNSIIIGADSSIPAHLGGLLGGNLNLSPFINAILGVFGGNYQNSFHMTNGTTTDRVYNLTIDKNGGIRWNSGNKGIFTK